MVGSVQLVSGRKTAGRRRKVRVDGGVRCHVGGWGQPQKEALIKGKLYWWLASQEEARQHQKIAEKVAMVVYIDEKIAVPATNA